MNTELKEALEILGRERNIPQEALLEAIESSLLTACKNHFGTSENCRVTIDKDSCDYTIIQEKEVVDEVFDPATEISLQDARMIDAKAEIGDFVEVQIDSQKFGRIATQNAKGVIVQKIREEERNSLFRDFYEHEHNIMTGVVRRFMGKNVSINLGKADAILAENEQIKGEQLKLNQRLRVYVLDVKNNPRGPHISVSRTHPDLVRCLFTEEVSEIKEGAVEIMAIAREAGSRTKMAVLSHDENVDPVGACVGVNGTRVNSIVDELNGEKIDIINWDDNPAFLIENALSPSKVICVVADEDAKQAIVIVPDFQLSLAIGKEGQNARLAAKLTGYKIDIKSESQAQESGLLEELGMAAYDEDGSAVYEQGEYEGSAFGDNSASDDEAELESAEVEDTELEDIESEEIAAAEDIAADTEAADKEAALGEDSTEEE